MSLIFPSHLIAQSTHPSNLNEPQKITEASLSTSVTFPSPCNFVRHEPPPEQPQWGQASFPALLFHYDPQTWGRPLLSQYDGLSNNLESNLYNTHIVRGKRSRAQIACNYCRKRKIRCISGFPGGSCATCFRGRKQCVFQLVSSESSNLSTLVSMPPNEFFPTYNQISTPSTALPLPILNPGYQQPTIPTVTNNCHISVQFNTPDKIVPLSGKRKRISEAQDSPPPKILRDDQQPRSLDGITSPSSHRSQVISESLGATQRRPASNQTSVMRIASILNVG